jgi:hypothetical protein
MPDKTPVGSRPGGSAGQAWSSPLQNAQSVGDFLRELHRLKMASHRTQDRPSRPPTAVGEDHVRYHVYVRLPFKRGDFVDPPPVSCCTVPLAFQVAASLPPNAYYAVQYIRARQGWAADTFFAAPQVNWDERKSEALWSIVSGVAKTEIDCEFPSCIRPTKQFSCISV